jgi:hypothetical protein
MSKPPLTSDQLKQIRERSDSPDVRALLWEIKRLRDLTWRVRGYLVTESQVERNELLRITSYEPVVRESSPKPAA